MTALSKKEKDVLSLQMFNLPQKSTALPPGITIHHLYKSVCEQQ